MPRALKRLVPTSFPGPLREAEEREPGDKVRLFPICLFSCRAPQFRPLIAMETPVLGY